MSSRGMFSRPSEDELARQKVSPIPSITSLGISRFHSEIFIFIALLHQPRLRPSTPNPQVLDALWIPERVMLSWIETTIHIVRVQGQLIPSCSPFPQNDDHKQTDEAAYDDNYDHCRIIHGHEF